MKLCCRMFRNLLKINCVTVCTPYLHHRLMGKTYSSVQCNPLVNDLRFQKCSSLLSSYGFNPGQVSRILKSPESILSFSEDQLLSNLHNWLSFDVKNKLFKALTSCPELLTLNPEFVNFRVKELMSLFTRKDINKLLVTCPTVFLEDFTNLYNKVEYIVYMMGVEQKSIVKSCALQFDFHHIKCRHIFLKRAGHYEVIKKSVKSKNPPLNKVFSRNIETFLKLTKLSEEEYISFCHCFGVEELELEEDSDSENDL